MISLSHRISIRVILLKKLSGRSKAVRYNVCKAEERLILYDHNFDYVMPYLAIKSLSWKSLKDFAMNLIRETMLRVSRKFIKERCDYLLFYHTFFMRIINIYDI